MDNLWLTSSLWVGLALVASLASIRTRLSVALVEIMVGAIAGNLVELKLTAWITYLAGVGSIVLTFLAGAEIDPDVVRRHFRFSLFLGLAGFTVPFAAVVVMAHFALGWTWPQAYIAGLAMSTTSVAVVYAVMLETGFNRTEMGKIILAACFVNDLITVLVLGALFANYNVWLAVFAAATAVSMWALPKFTPWFFARVGSRISEPESKFILLALFFLGGLGSKAKTEAVLPAYLIGMALAPFFLREKVLAQRMRVTAFTLLTPFFFLKAGALLRVRSMVAGIGLVAAFLATKMTAKFVGCWPVSRAFGFGGKERMYTTLLMSTGLTFGSICALFGLTNHIIGQSQYSVVVTAVIGSALIPTIIAQRWFQPPLEAPEEEASNV